MTINKYVICKLINIKNSRNLNLYNKIYRNKFAKTVRKQEMES